MSTTQVTFWLAEGRIDAEVPRDVAQSFLLGLWAGPAPAASPTVPPARTRRASSPVAPEGMVTTTAVIRHLGTVGLKCSKTQLTQWRERGCPSEQVGGVGGWHFYDPVAVAEWRKADIARIKADRQVRASSGFTDRLGHLLPEPRDV
jgi:hypothetical protein